MDLTPTAKILTPPTKEEDDLRLVLGIPLRPWPAPTAEKGKR